MSQSITQATPTDLSVVVGEPGLANLSVRQSMWWMGNWVLPTTQCISPTAVNESVTHTNMVDGEPGASVQR